MSENLINNGSFTREWAYNRTWVCEKGKEPRQLESGNAFVQDPWEFWWEHDIDLHLPEVTDAWREDDERRVVDGDKAIQYFKTDDQYHAGFYQQVSLSDGRTITVFLASREKWGFRNNNSYWDKVELYETVDGLALNAYFHSWSNHNNEDAVPGHEDCVGKPHCSWGVGEADYYISLEDAPELSGNSWDDAIVNVAFRVGIDMTGGTNPLADSVNWSPWKISYNYHHQLTFNLHLETESKCVCPRVDYERTAVLLWQNFESVIDKIRWRVAASIGTAEKLQTVMHSADDAGIGPTEGRNIIAVNPHKWGDGLEEFFLEYYPGVNYKVVNATTPTELVVMLQDDLDEDIAIGQNDPRWVDYDFGEQPDGGTIGGYGCFVVGLAILLRRLYKNNIYPHILDKALVNARSAYVSDNLLVWEALDSLFSKIEETKRTSVSEAVELFEQGWEVILRQPSPQHFVYVEDIDGDTVHIIDTFDGERKEKPLSNYDSARVAKTVYQPAPPVGPTYPVVNKFTGFQQQRAGMSRDEFISAVNPDYWMLLGAYEEARHIKSLSPDTNVVIRYVDNDWGRYVLADNKLNAANEYLDKFRGALEQNADCIDYVLGLNEYIAVNDYPVLEHVGGWVEAFCEALQDYPFKPVGLNVAVGNPQHDYICEQQGIPSQLAYLVPAVKALIEADGAVGYHTYWGSRTLDGGYYCTLGTDESIHYEMRALYSWDVRFVNEGLYPKYLFTEGGPIYVTDTGMPNAYGGWKKQETMNGNTDELIRQYALFDSLIQEWNSNHGNRARGFLGFIFGGFNEWGPFDVEGEPAMRLAEVFNAQI